MLLLSPGRRIVNSTPLYGRGLRHAGWRLSPADSANGRCKYWAGHGGFFKNVCGEIEGMNAGDPAGKGTRLIESFDSTKIVVEENCTK